MKLKRCYIDNFGKLSSREFNFSAGINTVKADNGYGKSTLAAFIKAMLYGLPDTKSQKLEENERRKFEPWQGGTWGGSLEFEFSGKNYRIERKFSKKASGDETKIFDTDTGKELFFNNGNVGEEIFGIDREGFERTVFLSEKSFSEKNENASIAAKLSDLSGVSFDMGAMRSALELLEEQRKFYHKQSGSGAIDDVKRHLSEAELRLDGLKLLEKEHLSDVEKLDGLLKEQASISLSIKEIKEKIVKANEDKLIISRREEKEKRLAAEAARIKEISKSFPLGFPTSQQIDEFALVSKELQIYAERGKSATKKQDPLANFFVSEEEIDSAASVVSEIKTIKSRIAENEQKADSRKKRSSERKKKLMLLSLIPLLLGILLGAALNPLFYILIAASLIPIAAAFASGKNESNGIGEIDTLFSLLKDYEQKFEKFRKKLPFDAADEQALIAKARIELREYEFKKLQAEKENAKLAEEEKHYRLLFEKYKLFKERFGTDDVESLRKLASEHRASSEIARRLAEELKDFSEEHSSAAYPLSLDELNEKARIYEEKLKKLNSEIALLKRKTELDFAELEASESLTAEVEKLEEKLNDYTEKYNTVKMTKSYLEAARDSMNARYLKKTMDSFTHYVSFISDEVGEYGMDTSFVLSKREGGQTKSKESYSKGTRELYDFALRLSLSDALYDTELPPLILDDPFAYFDDGKLIKAKELLRCVASERQIIYLVPVSERAI